MIEGLYSGHRINGFYTKKGYMGWIDNSSHYLLFSSEEDYIFYVKSN